MFFVTAATIFPSIYRILQTQAPRVQTPAAASKPNALRKVVLVVLKFLYPILLALQVLYKAQNERLVFLFQPCHLMTLLLAMVVWSPQGSTWGGQVFNFFLHSSYAPWLALLTPGACAQLAYVCAVLKLWWCGLTMCGCVRGRHS